MIVCDLHDRFISYEIISESLRGDLVFVSRIDIAPSDSNLPFILKRRQFPVIPAFAVTINKAQGQTYDYVGIDLSEPVFSHGQLYVALSKTRTANNIKVKIKESSAQGRILKNNDWFTKNIVFEELFS